MRIIGNLIWLIFGGLIASILWFLAGLIFCITIIGIPIGKQLFKISSLMLLPFSKEVTVNFGKHPILNIIWAVLFGWETAVGYFFFGVISFITIIGIPFGYQWFKLMKLAFLPFGAELTIK